MLIKSGFIDVEPIITSKNTYVAFFTNAEEAEYLVVEDAFPNGRPKLEEVGVKFTDRPTVDRVEKMKVCTFLNPLHTALAVFGCLLSYTQIYKEMEDSELKALVEKVGYVAGWCRYLLGVDDNGEKFEISPDLVLSMLKEHLQGIKLGQKEPFHEQLHLILSNEKIFGVNLYEVGLENLIETYFEEMVDAKGSVRATLKNKLK